MDLGQFFNTPIRSDLFFPSVKSPRRMVYGILSDRPQPIENIDGELSKDVSFLKEFFERTFGLERAEFFLSRLSQVQPFEPLFEEIFAVINAPKRR